ncbi:hypothetical protein DFH06DRAFT_1338837 [Mycena polygramma]|nr:hypothetical protein DFH06DRAFT_1338837 [Mycena polygramma]
MFDGTGTAAVAQQNANHSLFTLLLLLPPYSFILPCASSTLPFVAALISVAVASAVPASLDARAPNPTDCIEAAKYVGIHAGDFSYSQAGASITYACLKENGTSIWSHPACVGAATCQGSESVITLNQCQNPNVLAASAIPNMAAAIYGAFVGDSSSSGCPITQQNYVDIIYNQMSAAGVTTWPSSVGEVVNTWWNPILKWTAPARVFPTRTSTIGFTFRTRNLG